MKYGRICLVSVVALTILATVLAARAESPAQTGFDRPTCFTYHGRLEQDGSAADGVFDFEYELYDDAVDGAFLGRIARYDEVVRAGKFDSTLDFGVRAEAVGGWLEIHVREAGGEAFTTLTPRQKLAGVAGESLTVPGDLVVNGDIGSKGSFLGFYDSLVDKRVGLGLLRQLNGWTFNDFLTLRVNGTDKVFLDEDGRFGIGTLPAVPLHVTGGSDVTLGADSGYLLIGGSGVTNVVMDNNEIQARNNGAASGLYLNHDGGNMYLGGDLDVHGILDIEGDLSGTLPMWFQRVSVVCTDILYCSAECPAGTKVVGGGCWVDSNATSLWMESSRRSNSNGWYCDYHGFCPGSCDDFYSQVQAIAHCVKE